MRDGYLARFEELSKLLLNGSLPAVSVAGQPITFPAYLGTRVVELLVHADDVAVSGGLVTSPPALAVEIAGRVLVDAARTIHGDVAVLRALTRPERAPGSISVF